MKKLSWSLFFVFAALTFSSFRPVETPRSATATVAVPPGTGIGYQVDDNYYYTFYADLSQASPHPLTYIQVQNKFNSQVLTLAGFSGTVVRSIMLHYSINGTATVQFYDGSTLVTKNLTGFIEGGIIP